MCAKCINSMTPWNKLRKDYRELQEQIKTHEDRGENADELRIVLRLLETQMANASFFRVLFGRPIPLPRPDQINEKAHTETSKGSESTIC